MISGRSIKRIVGRKDCLEIKETEDAIDTNALTCPSEIPSNSVKSITQRRNTIEGTSVNVKSVPVKRQRKRRYTNTCKKETSKLIPLSKKTKETGTQTEVAKDLMQLKVELLKKIEKIESPLMHYVKPTTASVNKTLREDYSLAPPKVLPELKRTRTVQKSSGMIKLVQSLDNVKEAKSSSNPTSCDKSQNELLSTNQKKVKFDEEVSVRIFISDEPPITFLQKACLQVNCLNID